MDEKNIREELSKILVRFLEKKMLVFGVKNSSPVTSIRRGELYREAKTKKGRPIQNNPFKIPKAIPTK